MWGIKVDTFLFVMHVLSALLLVVIITFQKGEDNALSGLSGSGASNMGMVKQASSTNPFDKLVIILGIIFFGTSILLASSITTSEKKENYIIEKKEIKTLNQDNISIPEANDK